VPNTRNRPTDEQLLCAARAVIAEVGADRATMDMVAERGGTTRVTLYAHFRSRDALIDKVIQRELDVFTSWMVAAYDESEDMPHGARARHAVEALFGYARDHPDGFRVLFGHRDATTDPGRRLHEVLVPRIADRLRANYAARGAEIGAGAETLASLLLGMSLDVAYRAVVVGGADLDRACELAVTATFAVLRDVSPVQLEALSAHSE
jgi:AcrR family transcriptional regulator